MEAFVFAISAVTPIILLVGLGYFLKRIKIIKAELAPSLHKIVFRVLLPAMLFLNVYKSESIGDIDFGYIIYAFIFIVAVFLISIPAVVFITKKQERRGALLQATFRSNFALIGLPVSVALFGEEGAAVASLLSIAIIPLYNILAVISLSIFNADGKKPSVKSVVLQIVQNPLILGIAAGMVALITRALFVKHGISFRLTDIAPVFKVLEYLSAAATPLALLTLGAQFEFSAIRSLRREIIFGTVLRVLIVPLLGIGIAYILKDNFTGAHFATFVALFATPIATSSVPMAEVMGSDSALAGQLVIWTTLLSSFTIFAASYLLKLAGIF